ncbi:magnesium transporter (plasmid) [Pseudorhodobacter turbinis]|uniref:Magnesium transporter MgtE n=1 Tax=Pseudorhodobacter turbinis TaxID=2500533 RepID=A0A4P8EIT2_9RHOB|nr:magnesium transporter [Pseudorhodobacter turbinis]QCO56858.1 magnesium transporter [Pseudorhodobacter turbinis]
MSDDFMEMDKDVLDARRVEAIQDAVEANDAARLDGLLEPLHAADIADLLEQISANDRRELLRLWPNGIDGDILSELEEGIREQVIETLSPSVLADAVRELDTDDVVDILEDMEEEDQDRILGALEAADRVAVERALSYPDYSAGRLMQREVVAAPEHWDVGQAIDFMRSNDSLPDQFYHIILVDPRMKPRGYVTLGRMLSSRRDVALKDIAEESFRSVKATEPEADVAYIFNQYHLISCPVVDEDGRLVGVVTIDDAMNVLDEEHEEDMLRMAGVGDEASLTDTIYEAAKGRAVWLLVNLLTAILASIVISEFSESINQMVALAVLMPIVASMGGNAGTQTMTVAVRALATRDLTAQNAFRVIRREAAVGAINGVIFGLLMAAISGWWFGLPMLSLVIAIAMVLTLISAAAGGILIPMTLQRFGVDPALASGPFVTTVTDVVGFFAFLKLASWILL